MHVYVLKIETEFSGADCTEDSYSYVVRTLDDLKRAIPSLVREKILSKYPSADFDETKLRPFYNELYECTWCCYTFVLNAPNRAYGECTIIAELVDEYLPDAEEGEKHHG